MLKRIQSDNKPSDYLRSAENYIFIKRIGSGQFGTVELVQDKETGKQYAKKTIPEEEGDELGAPLYFTREFLSLLNTRYIGLPFLKLEGFNFKTKDEPSFIITEYLEGGSLDALIKSKFKDCDDDLTVKMVIIYGIAFALKILHSKNIIHRDLKPSNVLLDLKRHPYLGDFGFARQVTEKDILITGKIGSSFYMAPELIENDEITPDLSIDVYSFAIVTLEILAGALLMNGKVPRYVEKKILNKQRYDIPQNIPISFQRMIRDCWSHAPTRRWTMNDICHKLEEHELFWIGANVNEFDKYVTKLNTIYNAILRQEEEEEDQIEETKEYAFN